MARNLEKAAWTSGIITVILIIATVILAPNWPDPDSQLKDILAYFSDHHNGLIASGVVAFLSVPPFLLFASALRTRLGAGGDGEIAIGFVTATAATLASMVLLNSFIGGAMAQRIATPGDEQAVRAAFELFVLSFSALSLATGAFQLAGGIGILVSRAMPTWLGWFGIITGAISVVGGCGLVARDRGGLAAVGFIGLIGFIVWIASISVIQLRSAQAD